MQHEPRHDLGATTPNCTQILHAAGDILREAPDPGVTADAKQVRRDLPISELAATSASIGGA